MSDLACSLSLRPTETRRNFKFVARRRSRPELPHFTWSWGNASGQVDFHWKFENAEGSGKHVHVPIARADGKAIEAGVLPFRELAACEAQRLAPLIRSANPSWLRRNRYLLVWGEPDGLKEYFLDAFPKRRGKYHPNLTVLVDEDRMREMAGVSLYSPSLLKDLPPSRDHGLISAFSERREHPDLLISAYPRSNGALGWSIAPWREYIEFSGKLTLAFAQYVLPRIKDHHRDTFEHIIEMLCLEELPELAELIGGSRLLMHDPGSALVRLAFQVEQRHASVASGRPFTGPSRHTEMAGGAEATFAVF